ncbi:MAG TPA: hypothetical protein QGF05_10475 [Dehalococcoidia bacterium]|nr:hypothetical protein [Dehalococcoidia bacterium]
MADDPLPYAWLHVARPRENWRQLTEAARGDFLSERAALLTTAQEQGATLYGPYDCHWSSEWGTFEYWGFPDWDGVADLQAAMKALDITEYFRHRNVLGRKSRGPIGQEPWGEKPYAVLLEAKHDDMWYNLPKSVREDEALKEIGAPLADIFRAGNNLLTGCHTDWFSGAFHLMLFECDDLHGVETVTEGLHAFMRYHTDLRLTTGRRVESVDILH